MEEVDGVCDFYVLRKAEKNPKQKMLHKIKLLWRPELAHIQKVNHFFFFLLFFFVAGIQAEKQRFCPQKNHGKSTGRPAA